MIYLLVDTTGAKYYAAKHEDALKAADQKFLFDSVDKALEYGGGERPYTMNLVEDDFHFNPEEPTDEADV